MPSDQSLYHFYASHKSEPTLPRKRCSSEVGASALIYPQTTNDHFRRVYYKAIDLIVSAIYQESFRSYVQMETLLVKGANGDDYEADFNFLEASS